jgi:hypothetical protein
MSAIHLASYALMRGHRLGGTASAELACHAGRNADPEVVR